MNHGFVNVKFTIYVRTTVQQQDITTATTHLSNHNSTLRMLNLVFEPSNNRSVSQSCISMTSLLKHTITQPKIKAVDEESQDEGQKKAYFSKLPILKIFLRKFHGLVLGSVELIDAKGIDVAKPIWL